MGIEAWGEGQLSIERQVALAHRICNTRMYPRRLRRVIAAPLSNLQMMFEQMLQQVECTVKIIAANGVHECHAFHGFHDFHGILKPIGLSMVISGLSCDGCRRMGRGPTLY